MCGKLGLDGKGMLEKWYEFEATEQEKALREWCEEQLIQIDVDLPPQGTPS
jgi:hypothetical protein